MEKFFKCKSIPEPSRPALENDYCNEVKPCPKQSREEVNLEDLPTDPGLRTQISNYNPNDRDQIQRAYLLKGPCQPRDHNFPRRKFGNSLRRFNPIWFDKYPTWLEYSIAKDAAFCLCCYLFKSARSSSKGGDSFTVKGFTNWKKSEKFEVHIGGPNSSHNLAWNKYENLLNQIQHSQRLISKQSESAHNVYWSHLNPSIDCTRFLLRQGLAFRDDDESEESSNPENFLELLRFLANHNDQINSIVLQNAPENLKLALLDVHKDIVSAASIETTNAIMKELGGAFFALLIDGSQDISLKEQMAVALRFVDKRGCVVERFIGIIHVSDTTAISLKAEIDALFSKHGLSIARLRGQGYDGASNIWGEFNDLIALIMEENESAFYIHCFAHQFQLALVAIAKKHFQIKDLFAEVVNMSNVIGVLCKRHEAIKEKQYVEVAELLKIGDLLSGQGVNQEISIKRAGDTCWSSHYGALINLIALYSCAIDILDSVVDDDSSFELKAEARGLLASIQTFDFAFCLHLMKDILGITHELSQALQRKERDIVNAMTLVKVCKRRMQSMRDDGWDTILNEVSSFCVKNAIMIPNMDNTIVVQGRHRRKALKITNLHHYRVELFYSVIDMQLEELNNRFTEANTELLLCMACLNPSDSFSAFDKHKLIRFAQFYPTDFSIAELIALDNQLENYIMDMRFNSEFSKLDGIASLAKKMVETKKNILYPLVYLLVTLALTLPVATSTVERAFSAMNIVKNRLRNQMGDQWMNDLLVTYIEKDVFDTIGNDVIIRCFQNMKTRRGQL